MSYAGLLREALDRDPVDRAVLGLFAELVRSAGPGPVADVGCGPGRITTHLAGLGLDVLGVDLSPGMVAVGRRDHPELRFAVGSMTDLPIADRSLTGLVAWYSLIHVPDAAVPAVLAQVHRVLRPGGVVLLAFHVGEGSTHKTEGYGGLPMSVHVHRRRTEQVASLLEAAGFTVEARLDRRVADTPSPAGVVLACRP